MTDFTFDDFGQGGLGARVAAATWMNWAGAALSVSLIAGLGLWGVELLQRDVSGIPVVRAIEGPMRVAPEDPGGLQAAHQGLSVNAVAADGAFDAEGDITLAPAPVTLADEDGAADLLDDFTRRDTALAADAADDTSAPVVPSRIAGTDLAVAEALALSGMFEDQAEEVTEVAASDTDGISASPRPAIRPDPAVALVAVSAPATATEEIDPASVAPGTRLVQLGAFATPDIARAEWARAEAKFGPYLEGKSRMVTETDTGNGTLYRLRAVGFEDLADARRFCAVLESGGENCLPLVQR